MLSTPMSAATYISTIGEAGVFSLKWDGTNSDGAMSGSGIFFIRLATQAETRSARLTILR